MNSFHVKSTNLRFGYRLIPKFYFYNEIVKKKHFKSGINYLVLENECEKISDGEHSHITRKKLGEIRYLYGRNIKESVINYDPISDDSFISKKNYDSFGRCHIKQNDVLISILGTVGKSAIYKKEYVGLAGIPRHIANIRLKKNISFTGEYLISYFRSKIGKWQIYNLTTGNIQQLLSLKNLKKIEIPILNKKIIELITKNEKKALNCEVESLKLLEQAVKIIISNFNFKDSNEDELSFDSKISFMHSNDIWTPKFSSPIFLKSLKDLKKKFKTINLGKIIDITKGIEPGSDFYVDYLNKKKNDLTFVRTSDIINYSIDTFSDYFIDEEYSKTLNIKFNHKDVLFTKDGKIGCVSMLSKHDKVVCSSGIVKLSLNKNGKDLNFTQEYLFLMLMIKQIGLHSALRRTVTASTIPHLREERIEEIEIPIMDKKTIDKVSKLVEEAFKLKDKRNILINESSEIIDRELNYE